MVAALLPEPDSARFQSVRDRGSHLCGEVNAKAPAGGYTGYTRFVHDKASGATSFDPRQDRTPPPRPTAACAKPVSYQTVDERLSCAAAPAGEAPANVQPQFEALWRRSCT